MRELEGIGARRPIDLWSRTSCSVQIVLLDIASATSLVSAAMIMLRLASSARSTLSQAVLCKRDPPGC